MGLGARKPLGKDAAKKPAAPGHGGPRPGAGRPKDTGTPAARRSKKIASEIAEGKRLIEEGPLGSELPADATPLDVMLMAMRKAYILGGAVAAFPYAEKCAPYIHARIAQVELKNPEEGKPFRIAFQWQDE